MEQNLRGKMGAELEEDQEQLVRNTYIWRDLMSLNLLRKKWDNYWAAYSFMKGR